MNSNLVINYPNPQKASFKESGSASPAANSASPERSAKRYEAALEFDAGTQRAQSLRS